MRVGIRQSYAPRRQRVGEQGAGGSAISGPGSAELSAEIHGITGDIYGIHQDHLVVKRLPSHEVHGGLIRVRVGRRFGSDVERRPGLPAIALTEQIELWPVTCGRSK